MPGHHYQLPGISPSTRNGFVTPDWRTSAKTPIFMAVCPQALACNYEPHQFIFFGFLNVIFCTLFSPFFISLLLLMNIWKFWQIKIECWRCFLQRSCGVTWICILSYLLHSHGRNPLYLDYKLPMENPSVETNNFVLKKESCTCLGFEFCYQIIYFLRL